ncbi:hypothetical protein [Luteolibacter sp. Populi]|uniref:hypothetical protein n=1 Tax=Luteolibacter sp. Populi TaxID=3230487 RepID=UPI0034666E67
MNLTRNYPQFPVWPEVHADLNARTVFIATQHVTLIRYLIAKVLIKAAIAGAWILAFGLTVSVPEKNLEVGLCAFFLCLAATGVILGTPTPQILAKLMFPSETKVVFTPTHIWVNGNRFERENVLIGFRAAGSPIPWKKYNRLLREMAENKLSKHDEAKLDFSVVEMVYGGRPFRITNVRSVEAAQQFAVALQMASDASFQLQHSAPEAPESQSQLPKAVSGGPSLE